MESERSTSLSLAWHAPQLSVLALAACFVAAGGALLALGQVAIGDPSTAARCMPIAALIAAAALTRAAAHEIATCDGEITGTRVLLCATFLIGVVVGATAAPLVG